MIYLSTKREDLHHAWAEIDAHIKATINTVWEQGFTVDDDALSLRGHAHDAATAGHWCDALAILFAATLREPSVFLGAYQSWGWAIAQAIGVTGEAANGPSPVVTDRYRSSILVPPPWTVTPDRWASAHGQATVTPSGALRIEVARDFGRNDVVTLPLVPGRCRRA